MLPILVKATGPEHELEFFLGAAGGRGKPAVDVDAGLSAMRVVEAARRASELGRRVALTER